MESVYLGVYHRTGEHIIAKADGEAIRVRTVNRVVMENRWVLDDVLAVKATPRRPNPLRGKDGDDVDPKLTVDGVAGDKAEGNANEPGADRVGGEGLGRPEHADAHTGPR